MTVLAGDMSSESGDRSVLALTVMEAQGLNKRSKIRYTRSSLVSLAKLSTEQGLPRGIEPTVLSELDGLLERPHVSSYDSDSKSCQENLDKGLLSTDNIGLLGAGSLLGVVHGDITSALQPIIEEKTAPLLHKCKQPYRPPHLLKAFWNDYKDEVWVSPECPSKSEGHKQSYRRDFPEKEAFQENQKITSTEQRSKMELSGIDEIDTLPAEHPSFATPQHSDSTAKHRKSPATCSEFANQSHDIEQKPTYGISCSEGSPLIDHVVSNDYSAKVPDNNLKSTTDETSQLYRCKLPDVILGVLACVGLEHIFKPDTKEFSCSMLWDGYDADDGKPDSGDHDSHQLMLLSEEGTGQKNMTASSEQTIASVEFYPSDSITNNSKLNLVSKGNAEECEKDLTQEPSFGTSSTKELQWTSACTCNRLSSVGTSARKSVSQTCKFFFPIAHKNRLASATCRCKPSVINSEAIMFSSTTDQSEGRKTQSVSNDKKLNPVCCSDEQDSLPIELCLPDEDSLITVEDFRVVSYKDMVERNQVKADRVSPDAPVDSSRKPMDTKAVTTDEKSTHIISAPPVYKGNRPYRASPALINSQVKAVNQKFKPQNPSNQAFSTNVFPQQMVTTTYMQELYHVEAFPWNYQVSGYGCVPLPLPVPAPGVYGGTNLLGAQSNAGTGYYLGWQ